ncbi:MAG: alpha/beta hydrolase [Anaerolineaceae bacterium]|nr:alpha/beta hydrolase [Anaerolineaceae bacterium]
MFMLITAIKSPPGLVGGMIWFPKLWSSAWSPIFVLVAFIGAIMAGWAGKYFALLIGCLTIFLGIRHIWVVTREHHQFDNKFGPNWEDRIPSSMRVKLWKRRYQFIQPSSPHSHKQIDVEIGKSRPTDKPLLCDIHEPNPGIKRSGMAIIYLHAGAWQAFDKGFLTTSLFDHLSEQGHIILDLAYSLAPEAGLNRMLCDVKQAIIWMKSHAGDYQVNPERIVLMGASGGAHLALLTAYAPDHPAFQMMNPDADISVRAVISLYAVTDMVAYFDEYGLSTKRQPVLSSDIKEYLLPRIYDKTWLDRWMTKTRIFPAYRYGNMPGGALLLVNLLGGTLKEIPDIYKQASPIYQVHPDCPATLLIYAQHDFFVNVSHGRRLHEALKLAGATSIFIKVPEMVHAFDQGFGASRRIAPGAQTITYDIERFLALMV